MSKFDDLLKEKAIDEKENFTLPKSFEDRMQETLDSLDSVNTQKKWYFDKKILAMAACFAFIMLVGVNSINNNNYKSSGNVEMASEDQMLRSDTVQKESSPQAYGANNGRARINVDGVKSLTIKVLEQDTKYKNINIEDDILKIINLLTNLEVMNTDKNIGAEWDFLIQINGAFNSSIIIKDNIMSVNDEVYEIVNWNKSNLIDLYNNLEYEENYIKYCPTN